MLSSGDGGYYYMILIILQTYCYSYSLGSCGIIRYMWASVFLCSLGVSLRSPLYRSGYTTPPNQIDMLPRYQFGMRTVERAGHGMQA